MLVFQCQIDSALKQGHVDVCKYFKPIENITIS